MLALVFTSAWTEVIGCLGLVGGIGAIYRTHNCHVQGCWRLQWHVHLENGHPVCKKHHPHDPATLEPEA